VSDPENKKVRILFLCTGNSCRSQMAEGWARHLKGDVVEAYSAGIETHGLNQYAVKVMGEAGVDISSHSSKNVRELLHIAFDYVVTVCDSARENCPFFPGEIEIGKSFPDPSAFTGTEEEILGKVRIVRDEIKNWVESTFCKENILAEKGGFV